MNVIELLVFFFACFGLGFLGHLISARYGWLLGAVLAVPVLILMLLGSIKEFRQRGNNRPR
jgi:uncharacterized membrane protein YjjB (DUF3815 family)